MKAPSQFTLFSKQLLQHLDSIYWNYQNSSFSYTELSHRSKYYADLNVACMNIIKKWCHVPQGYQVIFLAVGQTYPAIPFNLLKITDGHGVYFVNGQQGIKNYKESSKHNQNVLKVETLQEKLKIQKLLESKHQKFYTWYSYKELLEAGQQVQQLQKHSQNQILICDLSYCVNIQKVDVQKHGIVHFRSGTGLGILGTQVLIVRKDLINQHSQNCPDVLDFQFGTRMKSIINTPSTLSTLVLKQNIEYLLKNNKDQSAIKQKLQKIKQVKLEQFKQLEAIQIVHTKGQLGNSIKFRLQQKGFYNEENLHQYFRFDKHLKCWQIFLQEENQHFVLNSLFLKNNN